MSCEVLEKCRAIACDLCVATELGQELEAVKGASFEDLQGNRDELRFRAKVGVVCNVCWAKVQLEYCLVAYARFGGVWRPALSDENELTMKGM